MTISARVIADSLSPDDFRLTTLQLRYPRFVHPELMTHRVFSRSASSSRAIPVKRLIDDVINDPVYPSHWGANQPGMQADGECNAPIFAYHQGYITREEQWDIAREVACNIARKFSDAGYHKQIVNRLLEPFAHINVVITATEWSNFFALRAHPDAQPEIRELAEAMRAAREESTPQTLQHGQWHLPYVTESDVQEVSRAFPECWAHIQRILLEVSTARCARVSYKTHDGRETRVDEDRELFRRLVGSEPKHASPAEHQATPDRLVKDIVVKWSRPQAHANFHGWIQHRKLIANENL